MASTMRARPRHLANTLKQSPSRTRLSHLHPQPFQISPRAPPATITTTSSYSMSHKPPPNQHYRPPPPTTFDSHMHIVSPDTTTYPLAPTAQYSPHPHTLDQYTTFLSTLPLTLTPSPSPNTDTPTHGLQSAGALFVQPSPYGHDNTLVLAALSSLPTGSARGIVVLPSPNQPDFPSPTTLEDWHAQGVRGVRVNLVSVGRKLGREELWEELSGLAERIRDVAGGGKWVLQLYIPLSMCAELEGMVEGLGCRVVVDHMGSPALPAPGTGDVDVGKLPGFAALLRMLEQGIAWVKVSGWYRLSKATGAVGDGLVEDKWLDAVGRALIAAREGTRVVWASDWPHTRFEEHDVDVIGFAERCWRWCEDVANENGGTIDGYATRLFSTNARELWDA